MNLSKSLTYLKTTLLFDNVYRGFKYVRNYKRTMTNGDGDIEKWKKVFECNLWSNYTSRYISIGYISSKNNVEFNTFMILYFLPIITVPHQPQIVWKFFFSSSRCNGIVMGKIVELVKNAPGRFALIKWFVRLQWYFQKMNGIVLVKIDKLKILYNKF